MKTEQAHNNKEQWKKMRFDQFFDMLPTNTLSRDKLNNQRGEYQNIHYGDVLIKYPYCLDCNVNDIPYINEGVRFNTTQVKNGDVIFADTAEDDTVGKCVEVLNVGDRKIVSGLHTYFCRPKHEMAPGYLGYFLNSNHFHNQLLPYIAGSKVSSVNRTSIARTFIFYPESLPAQRHIAAILSSADKVIASTQKVIAKYKQMKQGMMEDLLKPKEGWKMVKLGECLKQKPDYGINAPAVPYDNNLPTYLRITDITEDGYYSKKDIVSVSSQDALKYVMDEGDLVFARTGASTGKTYLYNPQDGMLVFAGFLIRVRTDENKLLPEFFKYQTQTPQYKNWIAANSMRTGQPGINGNEYEEFSVPIPYKNDKPDLVEQHRIAAILSGIDAKIAAEEKVLEKYEKVKKGLMEKLLNE